jgi:prepilin-type N-terminal cleavage/methylation domain-containing protein
VAAIKRQLGFTLLEVVMAITLMSGIMLILFSGLRISMNALRRGNDRLDAIEHRLAEGDILQSQVSSAIAAQLSQTQDGKATNTICFRGDGRQARFLSRVSWAADRTESLWLARYRVVDTQEGKQQLEIAETGILESDQILNALLQDDATPDRSELFGEPADRIELLYWQSSSDKIPAGWVADWKPVGLQELPRGIQIHWQRGNAEQTVTYLIPAVEEVK